VENSSCSRNRGKVAVSKALGGSERDAIGMDFEFKLSRRVVFASFKGSNRLSHHAGLQLPRDIQDNLKLIFSLFLFKLYLKHRRTKTMDCFSSPLDL
jgi:hypothetical protein